LSGAALELESSVAVIPWAESESLPNLQAQRALSRLRRLGRERGKEDEHG